MFKAARVTDKKTGKSYWTIKLFTADKKIKAAWNKFVSMYGEPVFADDPKRPNLFPRPPEEPWYLLQEEVNE